MFLTTYTKNLSSELVQLKLQISSSFGDESVLGRLERIRGRIREPLHLEFKGCKKKENKKGGEHSLLMFIPEFGFFLNLCSGAP